MWVTFDVQIGFDPPLNLDWTPSLPLVTFNYVGPGFSDFADGVYIVWRPEPTTGLWRAVYVGQGIIKTRLSFHRRTKLEATDGDAYLRATWAGVEKSKRDGVEAFLAEYLRPEQRDVWPNVANITVNLPEI